MLMASTTPCLLIQALVEDEVHRTADGHVTSRLEACDQLPDVTPTATLEAAQPLLNGYHKQP